MGSELLFQNSRDWDLSEIWYATSEDGFTWQEQGVAIPRPPKPNPGWRSVSTTDILKWEGKYYLYYQAFRIHPSKRGDDCPVAISYADSPDGPWTPANKIVIPNGAKDEWDGYSIHDPYPLVYKGKSICTTNLILTEIHVGYVCRGWPSPIIRWDRSKNIH